MHIEIDALQTFFSYRANCGMTYVITDRQTDRQTESTAIASLHSVRRGLKLNWISLLTIKTVRCTYFGREVWQNVATVITRCSLRGLQNSVDDLLTTAQSCSYRVDDAHRSFWPV